MLHQLTYVSVSVDGTSSEVLDEIHQRSIELNETLDITGCLIYYERKFFQILEGSKEAVLNTFKNIEADNRHHTVKLLSEGTATNRLFPDWSMGFYNIDTPNDTDYDFIQFKRNLFILSQLASKTSATELVFWTEIKKALF